MTAYSALPVSLTHTRIPGSVRVMERAETMGIDLPSRLRTSRPSYCILQIDTRFSVNENSISIRVGNAKLYFMYLYEYAFFVRRIYFKVFCLLDNHFKLGVRPFNSFRSALLRVAVGAQIKLSKAKHPSQKLENTCKVFVAKYCAVKRGME